MFGFTKKLRFNQEEDFRRLFRNGKKFSQPFFAIYSIPNSLLQPRLGLIIAKKSVRYAVQRNQIKRIIRESFRLRQADLAKFDVMVLAYKGIAKLNKAELRLELERGWSKLIDYYKEG